MKSPRPLTAVFPFPLLSPSVSIRAATDLPMSGAGLLRLANAVVLAEVVDKTVTPPRGRP